MGQKRHTAEQIIWKLLSSGKRRLAVEHVRRTLGSNRVSERRACQVIGQPRSTQRRQTPCARLRTEIAQADRRLSDRLWKVRDRRVRALLHWEGWNVNHKRIARLWRQEGLKVPKRQPKRRRLWLNDGSCIGLRPQRRDHVWSYNFVHNQTSDGRPL
jgi:putative transposase